MTQITPNQNDLKKWCRCCAARMVRGAEGLFTAHDAKTKGTAELARKRQCQQTKTNFSPQLLHGPARFHLPTCQYAFNSHLFVRFSYHCIHLLIRFQLSSASPISTPPASAFSSDTCTLSTPAAGWSARQTGHEQNKHRRIGSITKSQVVGRIDGAHEWNKQRRIDRTTSRQDSQDT